MVTNILRSLDQLATGVYVDPIFTGINDFEFSGESRMSRIFHLLGISFYHGWIIDPRDPAQIAIGKNSYNELTQKVVCDDPEIVKYGKQIKGFLKNELTVTGLQCLQGTIKEHEPCVFYWNQHFYTLVKTSEAGLFTLVTDEAFLGYPDHVWQRLESVRGPTGGYFNCDFDESPIIALPSITPSICTTFHDKKDSLKILALWDIENVSAKTCEYDAAERLRDNVRNHFSNILRIIAIANNERLHTRERTVCDDSGVSILDVPRTTKDVSDIRIILEMFRFVLQVPPPAFLMLISGDGDYSNPFECIGKFGYTTVLLYPKDKVAPELKKSSDYSFEWEESCKGQGLINQDGSISSVVQLKNKSKTEYYSPVSERVLFFWEIRAYTFPSQQNYELVVSYLATLCCQQGDETDKMAFYAFGNVNLIPKGEFAKGSGITYVTTCQSRKSETLEIKMLVKILSIAVRMKVAGHFIIVTRNEEYFSAIHFLRNLGHTVTIVKSSSSDPKSLLGKAATHTVDWPWDNMGSGAAWMESEIPASSSSNCKIETEIPAARMESEIPLKKIRHTRQGSWSKMECEKHASSSSYKMAVRMESKNPAKKPPQGSEVAAGGECETPASSSTSSYKLETQYPAKKPVRPQGSEVAAGACQGSSSKIECETPASSSTTSSYKMETPIPGKKKTFRPQGIYKSPGVKKKEEEEAAEKRRRR